MLVKPVAYSVELARDDSPHRGAAHGERAAGQLSHVEGAVGAHGHGRRHGLHRDRDHLVRGGRAALYGRARRLRGRGLGALSRRGTLGALTLWQRAHGRQRGGRELVGGGREDG